MNDRFPRALLIVLVGLPVALGLALAMDRLGVMHPGIGAGGAVLLLADLPPFRDPGEPTLTPLRRCFFSLGLLAAFLLANVDHMR